MLTPKETWWWQTSTDYLLLRWPCPQSPLGSTSVPRAQMRLYMHCGTDSIVEIKGSGVCFCSLRSKRLGQGWVSQLQGGVGEETAKNVTLCPDMGVTIVTSCFQSDWHFPGTYHMLGIMPRPVRELFHLNSYRKACKGGFIITARQVRKQIHRDGVPEKS